MNTDYIPTSYNVIPGIKIEHFIEPENEPMNNPLSDMDSKNEF